MLYWILCTWELLIGLIKPTYMPILDSVKSRNAHTCSCCGKTNGAIELHVYRNPICHVSYTFLHILDWFYPNNNKWRKMRKKVGGTKVIWIMEAQNDRFDPTKNEVVVTKNKPFVKVSQLINVNKFNRYISKKIHKFSGLL